MSNILLFALLTANLVLISIVLVSISRVKRVYNQINGYIRPKTEGELSELAKTVDAISSVFARSFTAQLKTTLMGVESGIKRGEKAIEGDLTVDIAQQAGGLLGLVSQFPAIQKHIRRNPRLAQSAIQVLSNLGQPSSQSQPSNNHNSQQGTFNLKIGG